MADGLNLLMRSLPANETGECSDSELVSRVQNGDGTAFEELFNRHRLRVAQIACRFFRQRDQIEEIIQESFTKAYLGICNFSDAKESTFGGWLARITFNCCYDELRRMKRRPEIAASVSDDESAWLRLQLHTQRSENDIESTTITRDLATKLFSRLRPEDRFVMVLLEVEGMSVGEIAKSLNWSASKVKIRAFRARALLRRVLKRFM